MLSDRDYMLPPEDDGDSADRPPALGGFGWHNALLVLCLAVFFLQYYFNVGGSWVLGTGKDEEFRPPGGLALSLLEPAQLWRFLTFPFVHGTVWHVLLNALLLRWIGRRTERHLGPAHFLLVFVLSSLVGGLAEISLFPQSLLIGASAAIYGLAVALVTLAPDSRLQIIGLPDFSVGLKPIVLFAVFFDLLMTFAAKFGYNSSSATVGVAWASHVGGAVAGYLYARALSASFSANVRESQRREREWRDRRDRLAQRRQRQEAPVATHAAGGFLAELPTPETPRDYISHHVDPILEKVRQHGLASLSAHERRILQEASERLTGPDKPSAPPRPPAHD